MELRCVLIEFARSNLRLTCICISKVYPTLKSGFSEQNNRLNLCLRAVNSQRLFSGHKPSLNDGFNFLKLSGIHKASSLVL